MTDIKKPANNEPAYMAGVYDRPVALIANALPEGQPAEGRVLPISNIRLFTVELNHAIWYSDAQPAVSTVSVRWNMTEGRWIVSGAPIKE